ncbi:cilia- and flagella-associated protein 251-like [Engraulis encrasicolus]|uniref:cilia- and flagella-associated protein 251-like n=1 Tax=Engraulis encrasicolus TaxID=184585 RepID=UPI002FCEB57B
MMAKTAAERQREYRARRDADPEKRESYLRRERQRWRRDVEEGKKKGIKELSERGQRTRRKMWRQAKRRQKNRDQLALGPTPPVSETESHVLVSDQTTNADSDNWSEDGTSCTKCTCWNQHQDKLHAAKRKRQEKEDDEKKKMTTEVKEEQEVKIKKEEEEDGVKKEVEEKSIKKEEGEEHEVKREDEEEQKMKKEKIEGEEDKVKGEEEE